jgi:hypothetical protein
LSFGRDVFPAVFLCLPAVFSRPDFQAAKSEEENFLYKNHDQFLQTDRMPKG